MDYVSGHEYDTIHTEPAIGTRPTAAFPVFTKIRAGLSLDSLRKRLEDHVRSNPVKAVGQAVAAGYIIRFLPIRFMISTAMRLAPPLMLASRLWQGKPLLSSGQQESK